MIMKERKRVEFDLVLLLLQLLVNYLINLLIIYKKKIFFLNGWISPSTRYQANSMDNIKKNIKNQTVRMVEDKISELVEDVYRIFGQCDE